MQLMPTTRIPENSDVEVDDRIASLLQPNVKENVNRAIPKRAIHALGEIVGYRYGKRRRAGSEGRACMYPHIFRASDTLVVLYGDVRRGISVTTDGFCSVEADQRV
jgi:hypothetical protein